jgi:hypothetical protein
MSDDQSSPKEPEHRADAALKKTATPKPKPSPRPPATKADIAAQKRMDKTVIKRMRKR